MLYGIDEEHINYELSMMHMAFNRLRTKDAIDYNINYVAFCVHAVNLINLGLQHSVFEKNKSIRKFLNLTKKQVFTLTNKRTTIMKEKVQYNDCKDIYDQLMRDFKVKIND